MNERALALLDELLDCAADERAQRLQRIAQDDAALAALVRRWLDADQGPAPIPDDPAHFARLLGDEDVIDVPADRRIGPYRLLRELGRGGMGAVWLAERADGQFEQRVALKLIKRGMDTRAVQRRFLAERQILARLEHTHIARLLDGGIAVDGRPYFALEYVDGVPLLEYAQANSCGLRARLQLFIKLCAAVAYAHGQLIVHRDLKPSNILVESDGNPKLLDFGIAKVLVDEGEGDPTQTAPEQRYLTRAYAAPEQLSGAPIGTATDVYALGLVLFELLAGTRARLQQPVERVSQARARNTQAPPPDLRARDLNGDLDVIVMRACAADPTRRYGGAQALADDLQRFLDGKPVWARADSAAYRVGKFVKRHGVGVALAAAAVLALLGGSGVAWWQAQRAQAQATRATVVLGFVEGLFEGADPAVTKGGTVTARELLDRGAQRANSDFADHDELAAELKHTIGRLYLKLGVLDRAQTELDAALQLAPATDRGSRQVRFWRLLDRARVDLAVGTADAGLQRLAQAEALAPQTESVSGEAQIALSGLRAQLLHLRGDDVQALDAARVAYEAAMKAWGAEHAVTLDAAEAFAELLDAGGRDRESLPLLERVVAARTTQLGVDDPRTLGARANLADTLRDVDQPDRALDIAQDVLARRRRVLGETHPDTAKSYFQLGQVHYHAGHYREAEAPLTQAIAVLRQLEPTDRNLRASALSTRATNAYFQGDIDTAERGYRESESLWSALYGPGHRDALSAQAALAQILRRKGKMAEAITLLRNVVAMRAQVGGDAPERADGLRMLGDGLSADGKHAEAIEHLGAAADMALRLYGEQHPMPQQTRVLLARAYLNAGDPEQAATVMRGALGALQALNPKGHPDVARTQGYLARIELRLGNTQAAHDLARAQYEFLRSQLPAPDNPRVAEAEALWGECQLAAGKTDTGRIALQHAIDVLAKAQPEHAQLSVWRGLLKRSSMDGQ